MKEFIWKVCCLIWHFDQRVIDEYKKEIEYSNFEKLVSKEQQYYDYLEKRLKELDKCRNYHNEHPEDTGFMYDYALALAEANCYRNFWNNIYDELISLAYSTGRREFAKELRNKRR